MKKALSYILPVALGYLLGFIASQLQTDAIENWYPYLNKPSLTPPNIAFPIAWNIIYLLSGISFGLIWNTIDRLRKGTLTLWFVQLFFNFTWSISFFYMQNPVLGFINILILDALVAWYAVRSYKQNKAASVLFWPYLAWILFATYLNGYIMFNN